MSDVRTSKERSLLLCRAMGWLAAPEGESAKSTRELIERLVTEVKAHVSEPNPASQLSGQSMGHGHVWPRLDAMKARCGGPALCFVCRREAAFIEALHADPANAQKAAAETPVQWVCRKCGSSDVMPWPTAQKVQPPAETESQRPCKDDIFRATYEPLDPLDTV